MADDDQLIARLRGGDEAAFRLAVSTHHSALMRFARALVGDAIADEVVQETWLKALAALDGFEGRSSLRTWLLGILRNHAVTRLRAEWRVAAAGSAEDAEAAGWFLPDGHWRNPPSPWAAETPEALLAAKELSGAIEAARRALPPAQRAVLALRDLEGLEMVEICNILELQPSHARVLLHRARRALWLAVERQRGRR